MKIEFIIPTYARPKQLMCTISSIIAQYDTNWSIHVVSDELNPGNEYYDIKNYFSNNNKIRFSEINGPNKDYGNTARNYALQNLQEEWVVMTSDDNYYVPRFVEFFRNAIGDNTNFVYCNMVHNWSGGEYICIDSEPVFGKIDIGNFMTKSDLAKQIKLDTKSTYADATFVKEYLTKFNDGNIVKIDKFLYVHN